MIPEKEHTHLEWHQHNLWHFFNYYFICEISFLSSPSNYGICKKIWKGNTREWTGVVTRVLLIKVTVYIKVLIHRARGRANGNVKHSQREAPVLVTQQSGIKVLQVFQKRNFHERSSAKSRRRPSGQWRASEMLIPWQEVDTTSLNSWLI